MINSPISIVCFRIRSWILPEKASRHLPSNGLPSESDEHSSTCYEYTGTITASKIEKDLAATQMQQLRAVVVSVSHSVGEGAEQSTTAISCGWPRPGALRPLLLEPAAAEDSLVVVTAAVPRFVRRILL